MLAAPHYAGELCAPCSSGDHSREHGSIGCLRRVTHEFICACEARVGPVLLPPLPEIEEDEDG